MDTKERSEDFWGLFVGEMQKDIIKDFIESDEIWDRMYNMETEDKYISFKKVMDKLVRRRKIIYIEDWIEKVKEGLEEDYDYTDVLNEFFERYLKERS